MRGPSVYKHVPDKATIEDALAFEGLLELTKALQQVTPTFAALAAAYRNWARTHPHMHRLLNHRPLDRVNLPAGLEDQTAAPLLTTCHGDRNLARAAERRQFRGGCSCA